MKRDCWVAQCLEHDIGAQAPDIDTLNVRLGVVLNAELNESLERHGKPFAGIDPAPARFHLMWERRARSVDVSPSKMMGLADNDVHLDFALAS